MAGKPPRSLDVRGDLNHGPSPIAGHGTARPHDLTALRLAYPLPAVAAASTKLTRSGAEWKGCCPFHSDATPSFTIFAQGQRFHCFGCGAGGDVFDFLQRLLGIGLAEALDVLVAGHTPAKPLVPSPPPAPTEQDRSDRIIAAREIWRSAVAAEGTPAETYLRARGIHMPIPASIRFARLRYPRDGGVYPVLVAAVVSPGNRLTGIQRIYLNGKGDEKARVPRSKLSLGKISGGAIRLASAAATMAVTEGLEDGLTLMQVQGHATWVACGAANLPRLILPHRVETVIVGGDNDPTGRDAAARAVAAHLARGIRAHAIFPLEAKDFNAELMRRVGA